MRSYSSLLVFETVFDSFTNTGTDLDSLYQQVFYQTVPVVEDDCLTHLGEPVDVNFEIEGRVELATGLPISRDRIVQLLSQGVYSVHTRTLSTCISDGGVCSQCYHASRPWLPSPAVDTTVVLDPFYDRSSEVLYASGPTSNFPLSLEVDTYDRLLVFFNGQLQDPSTYNVDGTTLRLLTPTPANSYVVVRYVTETKVPYMLWLADTYSGSLLGMKSLPGPMLPVRSLLLTQNVPEVLVERLIDDTKNINAIPANMLEYLGSTEDNLEKALFLIALRTIYGNVSN